MNVAAMLRDNISDPEMPFRDAEWTIS